MMKITLSQFHYKLPTRKYIVVPSADFHNDVVSVCKSNIGIDNSLGNPSYTLTPTKEEILNNHKFLFCSFGISTKDDELDVLTLYWLFSHSEHSIYM